MQVYARISPRWRPRSRDACGPWRRRWCSALAKSRSSRRRRAACADGDARGSPRRFFFVLSLWSYELTRKSWKIMENHIANWKIMENPRFFISHDQLFYMGHLPYVKNTRWYIHINHMIMFSNLVPKKKLWSSWENWYDTRTNIHSPKFLFDI